MIVEVESLGMKSQVPQPEFVGSTRPVTGEPATIKFIQDITIGIVFVLFIGFAGMFVATAVMFIDAYNAKAASYENLQDEVQSQNAKIDQLTKAVEAYENR